MLLSRLSTQQIRLNMASSIECSRPPRVFGGMDCYREAPSDGPSHCFRQMRKSMRGSLRALLVSASAMGLPDGSAVAASDQPIILPIKAAVVIPPEVSPVGGSAALAKGA